MACKNTECNCICKNKPVSEKQARARVAYLKTELAHEGHWDGWSIAGMQEELKWLEKQLEKLDASETSKSK